MNPKIIIASDQTGLELKNKIIPRLETKYLLIDLGSFDDFVDCCKEISNEINKYENTRAILFDDYGVGSFIAANKFKNIIAALATEEHTSKMTRQHNSSNLLVIGSLIVGAELAYSIIESFLENDYSKGRHQVRVDMLNKMI